MIYCIKKTFIMNSMLACSDGKILAYQTKTMIH
jgi:hypothetical protein